MAGSAHDEDEEVLDLADQTNRPPNTAFNQQRIQAWHPILHPVWVIVALFYFGVIMVPVGYKLDSIQDDVVELKVTYDEYVEGGSKEDQICGIGENYNEGKKCQITFTAPQYMSPPILVHYELQNFHQNHRNYYTSKDPEQLFGEGFDQDPLYEELCNPLNYLGNIRLNPCGLIANTFFNDGFTLVSGNDATGRPLELIEKGIAWQSDIEFMFNQPVGFRSEVCPGNITNATCCDGEEWSCKEPYYDKESEKYYRYFYPYDDTTQYLHETYKDIISPLEGVTNEHFIVWMRVATNPTFRKLYGWIDQPIAEGEEIVFEVTANYVVTRFKGAKSLMVGTSSVFGGRNPYLAPVFIYVGISFLVAGVFFAAKHFVRPRVLADPAYLHYKQD